MENNLSDEFKKALKASPELQKALSTNAGLMEQMVGFQNKLFTIQKEAYDYQKDTVKELFTMRSLLVDSHKNYKEIANIAGKSVELQRLNNAMADEALDAAKEQVGLTVIQKTGLEGIYAQSVAQMFIDKGITDEKEIQRQLESGILDDAIALIRTEQDKTKVIQKQNDLTKEIAARTLEIREEAESYKKKLEGALATARAIGNDPKTMGAFMLTQGIEKVEQFHQGFEELHHQGLSAGQAIEGQFKGMSMMSMLGLSDTKGALQGVVEEYGNINALSGDTVDALGQMAHHFGISGQEAAKVHASLARMPGETEATAKHAMAHTGHLAEMQGIAPGKIMKDMAANTGEMARAGAKGAEEFGKSVIELHKMGMEMQTASKIADGLLDFESSINAQNEASVLLGKEINLDKARELALNNDIEGMSKEILKNVGSSADFQKMNRLEQDALAKSVGMTVEELTKSLDAQEESNKYYGEGSSLLDNMAGKVMEWGAGVGGFLKENGMLIMSTLQFMSQSNILTKAGNVLLAAKNGLLKAGQFLMGKGGATNKLTDVAGGGDSLSKTDEASSKMKGGGKGFKESMKGLADGFKEMGVSGVLKGIINTAVAGPALIIALPSIPFLLFMGLTPLKMLATNFTSLAEGLSAMGTGKVSIGSLNLMLYALAAVVAVAGIPFMIMIALLGNVVGMGLKGLAGGLEALAKPQVAIGILLLSVLALSLGASIMMMGIGIGIAAAGLSLMFEQLANMPIENMLFMPIALQLMGIGLLTLGVAALIAGPGLLMVAVGLGLMVPGLLALSLIASTGAFDTISSGLIQMSQAAPGLLLVATAVGGIAAGLGLMAIAGFAALPAITALIGLAAVAPALVALGGALGGLFGGGGEKEDKMDELIGEIRELKAIMSQGGVVNMDGKKVGDVLRLAISTSGVR